MKKSFTLRSREKIISNISTNGDFCLIETYRRNLRNSALLLFLSLLAFVFLPYVVADANAETASTAVSWTPVSLTLDTDYGNGTPGSAGHGDVEFSVIAPSSVSGNNIGTQVVSKKTIAIETTGKYYGVYLSTGTNDNDLTLSGSNLAIESINSSYTGPSTTAGSNGTSFSTASWGFAVPSTTDFPTGFANASVYSNYDSSLGEALTSASSQYYNTGTWAAVPTLAEGAKLIQSAATTNPSGFGGEHGDSTKNKFDVYYSVIVDNSFIAGNYNNTVVYTAIASGGNSDSVSNNIARSLRYGTGGDTETLQFDLAASVPTITQSQVSVYLVPHSVTEANKDATTGSYSTTGLSTYMTNTYKCPITSFTLTSSKAEVECTIPSNPDNRTEGGSNMYGEYDFLVHIDTYNFDYVSRYKEDGAETASFAYAGLQTKKRNNTDYVFTKMQEMTASICKNTNMWNRSVGTSARVYDYRGEDGNNPVAAAVSTPGQQSDALGVGTFALKDVRDQKDYLVRRLADGNCWMVQNLDLDLTVASNRVLDPSTSDVTEHRVLSTKNLSDEIGSSCSEQYQHYNVAGSNCFWGSSKDESGNPISVTNNTRSDFARSYSNTVNGDPRYVAIQQLDGRYDQYGNSSDGINVNSGSVVPTTIGYIPTTVIKSGVARGYYGLMYVGTYYNWYAATAETGTRVTTTSAPNSICPAGWQLPINGDRTVSKSWSKLIQGSYELVAAEGTQADDTPIKQMHELPLTIPHSGYYEWNDGKLYDRGHYGDFWSGTASANAAYARHLGFNNIAVWPQGDNNKTYGFNIRCVSR